MSEHDTPIANELPLSGFSAATQAWFANAFDAPTRVQSQGWPRLARGEHALLLAPTGSGKTLAAFLASIDRLSRDEAPQDLGVRTLYVSPLKALAVDVERNLRSPIVGIENAARVLGLPFRRPVVDVRTGDTPAKERHRQARHPGDILVTTPESLFLLLTSRGRESLKTVETVILDEIHALAGTKRGVHLALSLERLVETTGREFQRIGLSATQRPLDVIARFLGGEGRTVHIVDTSEPPRIALRIVVPVDDMERPALSSSEPSRAASPEASSDVATDDDETPRPRSRRTHVARQTQKIPLPGASGERIPLPVVSSPNEGGIWPSVYPAILDEIRRHKTTIVFTNSRILCERIAQKVNELAGQELVRTHHGSLSHARRAEVEDQLKRGALPAIVATSSLELGIDMGAVDLVILVESPGSASRGLQRIGRASHHVGGTSEGVLFPKFRGDLLEATVVADEMQRGHIEETRVPQNCLDVLAQHVVAMVAMEPQSVSDILRIVRRASPYRELSRELLLSVLDMLSGHFPSDELADLTPRIVWDRGTDMLTPRRGALSLAVMNAGTIPDRGLYAVHLGPDGPRIGELDEEMTYESRQGDTIILGSSTWRVEEITRDRVIVSPAPGEPGRLPFWKGERVGRPLALGRAIGAFLSAVEQKTASEIANYAQSVAPLDERAARNLSRYIDEQRTATGALPSDRTVIVERFQDEIGDWRVCVLTPFGSRVHMPWALAIQHALSEDAGVQIDVMWSDDGIALRLADTDNLPAHERLFPDASSIEEIVLAEVEKSSLFASSFRENAGRALLLPKRRMDGRTPLWMQRRRSEALLAVARRHPRFPIVLETVRECMVDVFDVPALKEILAQIARREIRVVDVETKSASPFARSLVFQYVAAFLYEGDAPLADRRAAALSLDRALLAELLGQDELRDLLDRASVDEIAREAARLDEARIDSAERLHDHLRRLGDLTVAEIAVRATVPVQPLIDALVKTRQAIVVRIASEDRVIAIEDAARFRDALGTALPGGVPDAFLAPVAGPLDALALRFARARGPFTDRAFAERYALLPAVANVVLTSLVTRGLLIRGALTPGGQGHEWCDPDVLKCIKRRALERLRNEIAPVDAHHYARFLLGWHGVLKPRFGSERLLDAIVQLEGVPLPLSDLDRILSSRIADYRPAMLDELGASGAIVWVGQGALSPSDGKIALFRRERAHLLIDLPTLDVDLGEPHRRVLAHLVNKGASFFAELHLISGLSSTKECAEVLTDLVYAGHITNDTFQPLRARERASSRRATAGGRMVGGRFSLVSSLLEGAKASATERLLARAETLLEVRAVLARASVVAGELEGGFAALYPVLKELAERGRVRRGLFVRGLGGAQFALLPVVDRLRAAREHEVADLVLAATDPANPYGAALPWPDQENEGGRSRARRAAGVRVVLVDGECVLAVEKASLVTFTDDAVKLQRATQALRRAQDWRTFRAKRVDGERAFESARAPLLLAAGFARDHLGLALTRENGPSPSRSA
jgi:ATP-dependent Lhr-like helicase